MMAKKKSKKIEKKAEPKKAPKKTNTTGWVVGVIIVIVVIIAIILLLVGKPAETPVTPPVTTPTAPANVTPVGPEAVAQGPEMIRYCNISYAIGWPKNKLGDPCVIDGSKVSLQIVYSGKGDSLAGLWFQITTKSGKVEYFKDSRTMKAGEYMKYSLDAGEKITDMLAYPANGDKACLNQRMLVIKDEQCLTS